MKKSLITCLLSFSLMAGLFAEKEKANSVEALGIKKKIVFNQKHFNTEKGNLMLEGYDAVSYFNSKEPDLGSKKYSLTHEGVAYYFKSEENKNIFQANPEKYIPLYGGWCAYAMAKNGKKVSVDPKSYKIIDGKLYLFYNTIFSDTLKLWNKSKDETANIKKANQNWETILTSKK